MEHSLLIWLLPTLALVAGVAIGFLVARLLPNAVPNRTQRQLDDIQERFDSYQSEVVTHFNSTAALVKKLTQSYQDLTGQIIRRVATILRRLNENFASLGLKPHAEPAESGKGASDLAGPAVANLDHDAFSQNDADELLSGLGL